jgi:hypothetical protein
MNHLLGIVIIGLRFAHHSQQTSRYTIHCGFGLRAKSERRLPHSFAPFRKNNIVTGAALLFRQACRVPFWTTTSPFITRSPDRQFSEVAS